MARLGTMQRWMLSRIFEQGALTRRGMRGYYGKRRGWGRGDALTDSERVSIHRSFHALVAHGLIVKGRFGSYILTEAGFARHLQANGSRIGEGNVSFSEYMGRVRELDEGFERWRAVFTGGKSGQGGS